MEAVHVQEEEEEAQVSFRHGEEYLKKPCSSHTHVESVSQREVSSCVSLKSDRSMPHHPAFPLEPKPAHSQLVESVSQREVTSCVSLKSDRSMPHHPAFPLEPRPAHSQLVESVSQREVSSCVSLKSDRSMPHHPAFPLEPKPAHSQLVESVTQREVFSCVSLKSDHSMPHHPAFPLEPRTAQTLQETAGPGPSSCSLCGGVQRGSDSTSRGSWCRCATSAWNTLQSEHKRHLEQSCESVSEGAQKERTSLSRIYTELYITESHAEEVPTQHEEMQLETVSKRTVHHTAIRLSQLELSKPHCDILVSALKADPSLLRELDLSKNPNISSVMNSLCKGLASVNCRLETLRLKDCNLSESSCSSLGSALKSNPSHLRELDLRNNWNMKDSGVEHLCGYLRSPDCLLDTLRLSSCSLSELSCVSLASALSLCPSHLRLLDVGWNRHLGDPGVQRLCVYLQSQHCSLEILRLNWCGVSGPGCSSLALAKPSSLTYLDLGGNDQLDDRAVEHLCGFLQSPLCRLETLRLNSCGVSRSGCSSLASALRSNSHLKEINLWYNFLNDSDLQPLYQLVQSPHCPLESVLR